MPRTRSRGSPEDAAAPSPQRLDVTGLHCTSCAASLEETVGVLPEVQRVEPDGDATRATVVLTGQADAAGVVERIRDLGFDVADGPAEGPGILRRLVLPGLVAAVVIGLGIAGFNWAMDYYLQGGGLQELNDFFAVISLTAVGVAFLLGFLVGFSPFSLAVMPAVAGYVARSRAHSTRRALTLATAFVAGSVTVDLAVGAAFAGIGRAALTLASNTLPIWYALITLVLVGLAAVLLGWWRPSMPTPDIDPERIHSARSAYLMGVPFGLMACPACTPLLLPVALGAAATGNVVYGAGLMGAFAVGRGIPLLAAGVSAGALTRMRSLRRYIPVVERVLGLLLLGGAAFFLREFVLTANGLGWF